MCPGPTIDIGPNLLNLLLQFPTLIAALTAAYVSLQNRRTLLNGTTGTAR